MADVRSHPSLGDYLVREGIITQSQFNSALSEQRNSGGSIGRILVHMGLITESMRLTILQKHFGYEFIRLKNIEIDPLILTLVTYNFAQKHSVVPIRQDEDKSLVVAMEDPSDLFVTDFIKNQIGMRIRPVVTTDEDIQAVLSKYPTQERLKAEQPATKSFRSSRLYRFVSYTAFPVLAFAPLAVAFIVLAMDAFGFAQKTMQMIDQDIIGYFDIGLWTALIWGLWSIILFEINGLLFGRYGEEEEEEELEGE